MSASVHVSEPVLWATGAKVSIESSCNIIRSICSADAEKQERQYRKKIQNSRKNGIRNILYPRFIHSGMHLVFVAVSIH